MKGGKENYVMLNNLIQHFCVNEDLNFDLEFRT